MSVRSRYYLIFIVLLVACNTSIDENSTLNNTAFYEVKIPLKNNFKADSYQIISLDKTKSIHKLDFGTFSTISTIEIFADDSAKIPLKHQQLEPGKQQLIDITSFKSGVYNIHFTAIAQGCVFHLEIK